MNTVTGLRPWPAGLELNAGPLRLALRLSASLPFLVVFTPADKPYFCVEPVGHVNHAVGLADPAGHGLHEHVAGATLAASCRLEIAPA